MHRNIPIPQASYDEHLRRSKDDLIHILAYKQNLVLPQAPQSAKSALIGIAKILHRETTPILSPDKQIPPVSISSPTKNYSRG